MAESTAGIGEAGALINKASAPSGMDITRGLQMAERTALKKAQMEAAKEAKKQARQAQLDKYRTVKTGLYKDPSVNEKAQKLGRELQSEMYEAINSGDMTKVGQLNQDIEFLKNDLKIEDNFLLSLAPDNNKVDTKDMLIAARQGKLDEYIQNESPLIQKYFTQDAGGFPIVVRPNKYNLDKAYDKAVASLGEDYVDYKAAAFDKIKMTKKVPPAILRERAAALVLNDAEVSAALDWNPEFKKVFKEEYGNNIEREQEAKVNFVYNNLTKYNEPKYQIGSQSKGGGAFKLTGSGFSIGDYKFSVIPTTAANFVQEAEGNRTMYGRDEVLNSKIMERNKLAGNTPVTKVAMPYDSKSAFIVSDPFLGRVETGKPVSLTQGGGKTYLVYLTKINNRERTQIVEMTPEILSQMVSYYKTDPETFIEAYGSAGIDLSQFASSGVISTRGKAGGKNPPPAKGGSTKKPEPAKTITSAQYRAMSVAERKDFKEKGGIVK